MDIVNVYDKSYSSIMLGDCKMTQWMNGIAKLVIPTPFAVGDVNVYLIKGERLTLVDAGVKTEEAWESFNKQLSELNLTLNDLDQVVLTHHHPDHVGFLDYLPETLPVYGHPYNQRWIYNVHEFLAEHDQFYYQLYQQFGIPKEYLPYVDRMKKSLKYSCNRSLTDTLREGDRPEGLSDWSAIETPGHAQSHIGLFREKDGVYIGGDHLLAKISSNPLLEPPLPGMTERPKPQLQYNASLKKLLNYPIELIYSGHGAEIVDVKELVERRLLRQHERAMKIKDWLTAEELTVFEICKRLFPTIYEREFSLTISETVAQLDYLEDRDEISITKDEVYLYKAK